ncbi:PaaI family thioesterase [Corynebacterium sp.]|uniref:PaaI family thioesterase n=1 Tax=Corynebacterium sp. TaxID=1720 RepID=UPI002A917D52|nr:PaaI family thioesterase [Corynebacterium sp.]MDY5784647.1 PaaI family thioesterase [Corynebacterium sp.]
MKPRLGSQVLETALNEQELAQLAQRDSGLSHTLGIVLTHVASDSVKGYIDIEPRHHQPMGMANGGVLCSVGETLGSVAAMAAAGAPAVGMGNSTEFLKGVTNGRVEGEAIAVHIGKSTHLWRVEMRQEGKLVATTNLRLMILREP